MIALLRTSLLALVAITGMLAAGSPAVGVTDPYPIYSISALSGGLAFFGKAGVGALGAYEDYFNANGGINGRPIHFIVEDSQTSPQIAVELLNQLKPKNLPVVLGPTSAAECNAAWALIKASGPVSWCYSSAVTGEHGSYEFQMGWNYDYNVAAVRWLRGRHLTRIATITSTDATGQMYSRSIHTILALPENQSLQLVDEEHFNPSDVNAVAQLSKIGASKAQVLFLGAAGSPAAVVFHGMADTALQLPVVTGNGNSSKTFLNQYAAILPKDLYIESMHCLPGTAAIVDKNEKAAYDAYVNAITSHGLPVDCYGADTWDPALIVTTALRHVGTNATADQLRAYIANMRVVGVNGTYDFKRAPQRGIDDRNVIISRWNAATNSWSAVSKPGGAPL